MELTKSQRRRGPELDGAILSAAWDELVATGYTDLTMDAVARRAETSRKVVYGRWADKAELTVAAIRNYLTQNPIVVPELNTVRDDMFSLMRQYADRGLPLLILTSLGMNDYFRETRSVPRDLGQLIAEGEELPLRAVMLRSVQRGEVDPHKLTPLVMSLPKDLLRHDFIMTQTPPTDEFIAAMVDEVFLPLIRV